MQLLIVGGKARDGLVRTHGKSIGAVFDETYKGPVRLRPEPTKFSSCWLGLANMGAESFA